MSWTLPGAACAEALADHEPSKHAFEEEEDAWPPNPYQEQVDAQVAAWAAWPGTPVLDCVSPCEARGQCFIVVVPVQAAGAGQQYTPPRSFTEDYRIWCDARLEELKGKTTRSKALAVILKSNAFHLAFDGIGCEVVQRAVEVADRNTLLALREELFSGRRRKELMHSEYARCVARRLDFRIWCDAIHEELKGETTRSKALTAILKNNAFRLAFDCIGCKLVEKAVEVADTKTLRALWEEFLAGRRRKDIMHSEYASYVARRLDYRIWCDARLEELKDSEGRSKAFAAIRGRLLGDAFDSIGCRVVQEALSAADTARDTETLRAFLTELSGHVLEMSKSPSANFVAQEMVRLIPDLCAVIGELKGEVERVACHRYGCRILIQILKRGQECATLVEELLRAPKALFSHVYAHHVMEALPIDHLLKSLLDNVRPSATRHRSSAEELEGRHVGFVIVAALKSCSDVDARQRLWGLLASRIVAVTNTRAGCRAFRELCELPRTREEAEAALMQAALMQHPEGHRLRSRVLGERPVDAEARPDARAPPSPGPYPRACGSRSSPSTPSCRPTSSTASSCGRLEDSEFGRDVDAREEDDGEAKAERDEAERKEAAYKSAAEAATAKKREERAAEEERAEMARMAVEQKKTAASAAEERRLKDETEAAEREREMMAAEEKAARRARKKAMAEERKAAAGRATDEPRRAAGTGKGEGGGVAEGLQGGGVGAARRRGGEGRREGLAPKKAREEGAARQKGPGRSRADKKAAARRRGAEEPVAPKTQGGFILADEEVEEPVASKTQGGGILARIFCACRRRRPA